MAKLLDSILVIDVESTCWEGDPPPGQVNEIIEIGLCVLDVQTGERGVKESILVRPERSQVSPFCTQLTTLTQEQVETGISFAEACEKLRTSYRSDRRVLASYGDYDRQQFDRQCRALGVRYPFGPTHLNVKNHVAIAMGWKEEVGLDQALERLKLPLEGIHHRGVDDAWNIARILSMLLLSVRSNLA